MDSVGPMEPVKLSKPGVLFDLDGTLVDTVHLHAVCWWEALRQHGHIVPMYAIAKAIGLGSDKLLPHLLGDEPEGAGSISDAQAALYRAHHGRIATSPGARELLARCDAAGKSVVLASSASGDDLQTLRGVLDSDEHLAPRPARPTLTSPNHIPGSCRSHSTRPIFAPRTRSSSATRFGMSRRRPGPTCRG